MKETREAVGKASPRTQREYDEAPILMTRWSWITWQVSLYRVRYLLCPRFDCYLGRCSRGGCKDIDNAQCNVSIALTRYRICFITNELCVWSNAMNEPKLWFGSSVIWVVKRFKAGSQKIQAAVEFPYLRFGSIALRNHMAQFED